MTSRATENTPLRGSVNIAYDPVPSNGAGTAVVLPNITQAKRNISYIYGLIISTVVIIGLVLYITYNGMMSRHSSRHDKQHREPDDTEEMFAFPPISWQNPINLVRYTDRPNSKPGPMFGGMKGPFPTNLWSENLFLGKSKSEKATNAYTIPYVVDTCGPLPGIRTHIPEFIAFPYALEEQFDRLNGLTLSAVGDFHNETAYNALDNEEVQFNSLVVELEWKATKRSDSSVVPIMRTPLVRGSPYITMEYFDAVPIIFIQRPLFSDTPLVVDEEFSSSNTMKLSTMNTDDTDDAVNSSPTFTSTVECGVGDEWGNAIFDKPSFHVKKEIIMQNDKSDHTWMIFVSEPMDFKCSVPISSTQGHTEIRAVKSMPHAFIRISLAYRCTRGLNKILCGNSTKTEDERVEIRQLLRTHAPVYPTSQATVTFDPPDEDTDDNMGILFAWNPQNMHHKSRQHDPSSTSSSTSSSSSSSSSYKSSASSSSSFRHTNTHSRSLKTPLGIPEIELLTYALPHHQMILTSRMGSSNKILKYGCVTTLHGEACPVLGGVWRLDEKLPKTSFSAPRPIRKELVEPVKDAVQSDIAYEIKSVYKHGAGDTYFSGKMLAKLSRILLIAEEIGLDITGNSFKTALKRLESGVEIWLNGSAANPLLYDTAWGGLIACGCSVPFPYYNQSTGSCDYRFPDCPAVDNEEINYGLGFYCDHHYHYGYFIYAAAVIAKYDADWTHKYHEHILLLIRDIANPSTEDQYFTTYRHKDWFLGSSWASGIITYAGSPFPWKYGRNQESTSEAIASYEAVALYGEYAGKVFSSSYQSNHHARCKTIEIVGKMLLATEIRSSETYWHVRKSADTSIYPRIYPNEYAHSIIGRMWSEKAELDTFFGGEEWKSYGIQLMPTTPIAEQRDDPQWLHEMFPHFLTECRTRPLCYEGGWSLVLTMTRAAICDWQGAYDEIKRFNQTGFSNQDLGGNGQSLTNSLWWIGTRPCT